ncbi:hypothetical protein EUX98_g2064 [Antrodiella citrinella]|uniref:TEA domain-containing protein n=1 Tax=Antrodiella citrinella TaxID=2447956 RepID=A0A4V3XJ86_9APHY|nr:hypothetical protein EUX98_g2064 [Antrodiella citrinella]
MSDAFFGNLKSLTPQRKHHKLLKDGREVWSEDVEKLFVQGLKDYWESPWATYSRGRSRWRNQFLVDHLKKHGIERSKKQVASHIQVLRNMWRGEAEYHLVAGGEELFQEDGLLASPKKAGTPSTPGSELADDQQASASSTPNSAVGEFPAYLPSNVVLPQFISPETTMGNHSPGIDYPISSPSSLELPYSFSPPSPPISNRNRPRPPVKLEPLHMHPTLFNLPQTSQSSASDSDLSPLFPPYPHAPQVRVLSLSLWAEGMVPFTADIDRLHLTMPVTSRNPEATSILIRVRMGISCIDDLHSHPNLHGFQAAVTFSDMWMSEAKVITKSSAGSNCISQEVGYLEVNPSLPSTDLPPRAVTCFLPESSLSRCKWLPPDQDNVTQQIAIDGVIVAAFVYHIERTAPGSPPSVEIVDFQKYKPQPKRTTQSPQVAVPVHASTPPISPPTFPQSASFGTSFIPMEASGPMVSHPHPNTALLEDYSFSPSMYRTDSSPPQLTATSSASVIYAGHR